MQGTIYTRIRATTHSFLFFSFQNKKRTNKVVTKEELGKIYIIHLSRKKVKGKNGNYSNQPVCLKIEKECRSIKSCKIDIDSLSGSLEAEFCLFSILFLFFSPSLEKRDNMTHIYVRQEKKFCEIK